jgi:hypothetical protein
MGHGCPLIRPSATFSLRKKEQAEKSELIRKNYEYLLK